MKKIVAVSGGEIGRPGTRMETIPIDRYIVRLARKKHPHLLFIPTASRDSEGYIKVVRKYFGHKLGCAVDVLRLVGSKPSISSMQKKILSADIVYVGGGNTSYMMRVWRKYKVDLMLAHAYKKGVVMSGISAGAICWFKYGSSDSMKILNKKIPHLRVRGLGFVAASFCPHYDSEKDRKESFDKMMQKTPGPGYALDDRSALVIRNDEAVFIRTSSKQAGYKVYSSHGKIQKISLSVGTSFSI